MILILTFLSLLGKESIQYRTTRTNSRKFHCIILILINFGLKRATQKAVILLILLIIFSPLHLYKLWGEEIRKLSRMEPHLGQGLCSKIMTTFSLGNSLGRYHTEDRSFLSQQAQPENFAPVLRQIHIFFFYLGTRWSSWEKYVSLNRRITVRSERLSLCGRQKDWPKAPRFLSCISHSFAGTNS